MTCPWIRSENKLDSANMVCDLATLPENLPVLPVIDLKPPTHVFCGGRQECCENPNLLQAEMELEFERNRFGLKEREVPAHLVGLNCTLGFEGANEFHIKGGR